MKKRVSPKVGEVWYDPEADELHYVWAVYRKTQTQFGGVVFSQCSDWISCTVQTYDGFRETTIYVGKFGADK